jgi:hypothetical protein
MTEPGERDADPVGTRMVDVWDRHRGRTGDPIFAFGALEDVQANMARTGQPTCRACASSRPGRGEDSPVRHRSASPCCALDTDWYESTRHELEHEFFAGRSDAPLLNRLDYTGRIAVKVPMG